MSFQETFDINYYHYCYYTSIHFCQKKFHIIKVSQKRGKIIYLDKNVTIHFFLHIKFYQNFKLHHAEKLNKTGEYMFCLALGTLF